MTKNTKIVWRLKDAPSAENLRELVKDGILSKDEAREILFSSETVKDRDIESLKSEIKFLRELVEKLSNKNEVRIVETIKEIDRSWRRYPWYNPYIVWCDNASKMWNTGTGDFFQQKSFNSIKTF